MKPLPFLAGLAILLVLSLPVHAETYAERFAAAKKAGNAEKIEALLTEWAQKEPNDPEALVSAANYWWSNATAIRLDSGKAGKGEFSIKDKDGKDVGRLGPGKPDEKLAAKAASILQKATEKFPNRLDIWCGLAYLQQETIQGEAQAKTLQAMVDHAKKATAADLRWKNDSLTDEPDKFVAEKLHGYARDHYQKETPESDAALGLIAKILTAEYPKNPIGWNDLALYQHFVSKDTKAALASLETAQKLDPKDFLVTFNIGKFAAMTGDKDKARKAFQAVIDGSKDQRIVGNAKEELEGLNPKPN